jgi:HlyD family secretion protein
MKKSFLITGIVIVAALILLFVFNKFTSRNSASFQFTDVKYGEFEIAISATGELIAEKSIDIKGPEFSQGNDIRSQNVKILDLVPEGTLVKEGDFIASLDKTTLINTLKDETERLETFKTNLEMKLLDSAYVLNNIRDIIKNQKFVVDEAVMTLRNSKFEAPTVIRQAEIELDKAQRVLEQRQRSYTKVLAQNKTDIYNQNYWISRITKRVDDIEKVLAGFTITAPASGMVIYKKEWMGTKRKVGSYVNPIDRVVATLPDLTSMISKTYVNEIDISKIKTGQKVTITVDAFPKKVFTGNISFVANIGEKLPNTTDKVFEVQIKIDGTDPALRPSMTTGNKIMIKTFKDAVYIPIECVQAGIDSITFVYTKSGAKQIVVPGESNEKNVIIEKGLKPGTLLYLDNPEKPENFRLTGDELIPLLKEQKKVLKAEQEKYRQKT